ncbi:Sulfite exporter TauE/SafE [Streptomyces malaysiensis subsp. malaysiensis]|nr:Sulfite exporter TauE/SafE [Streptomyces sp. M56]
MTAPVGVSGAVFLLPVQLGVFTVPNPAVTPTNLLYNVVSGPGALLRYRRDGVLTGPLVRRMVVGTLPGVVLGAVIRVFALPGPSVFRLLVAVLMLPLGGHLAHRLSRARAPGGHRPGAGGRGRGRYLRRRRWLDPRPRPCRAWCSHVPGRPGRARLHFAISVVGASTYAVLSLARSGSIAPVWLLGLALWLRRSERSRRAGPRSGRRPIHPGWAAAGGDGGLLCVHTARADPADRPVAYELHNETRSWPRLSVCFQRRWSKALVKGADCRGVTCGGQLASAGCSVRARVLARR